MGCPFIGGPGGPGGLALGGPGLACPGLYSSAASVPSIESI